MGWRVRIENEAGHDVRTLSKEFILSNEEIIFNGSFQLLKYLDPFGDTTFNSLMFAELRKDLNELEKKLPVDKGQIQEVLDLIKECEDGVHLYLKFYGD